METKNENKCNADDMTYEYRKYKAWLKKEKKMVDVLTIHWDWRNTGVLDEVITTNPSGNIEDDVWENRIKDVELLQFTGLKDVDGNEIYEGDVIASPNEFKRMKKYLVVNYGLGFALERIREDKSLNGTLDIFLSTWEKCKVTGNKYENPELLEV